MNENRMLVSGGQWDHRIGSPGCGTHPRNRIRFGAIKKRDFLNYLTRRIVMDWSENNTFIST
jgi:hypothetical protein